MKHAAVLTYFGGVWSGRELHCHIQSLSFSFSSLSLCCGGGKEEKKTDIEISN